MLHWSPWLAQADVFHLSEYYTRFMHYLPSLAKALLVLVVGWWLAGRIKSFLYKVMVSRHADATLTSFLSKLCYWLLVILVLLLALGAADPNLTSPLTGMLAAGTLAVGLALQSSMTNFAAGVMIILCRHFRVGDSITSGAVSGTVEEISFFDTRLVTDDNRKIIVPNGTILAAPIVNASAKPLRRLELVFKISYESNLKDAKRILLAALQTDIRALPDPPPAVVVTNLGDSSVDLTTRVWTAIGDYDDLRSHLLEEVKLRFDEAGIAIPAPRRDVQLRPVK
jgi:small conductance mechanosensitive channel